MRAIVFSLIRPRSKLLAVLLCVFACFTFPYLAFHIYERNILATRNLVQQSLSEFIEQIEEAKAVKEFTAATNEDPLQLTDDAKDLSIGGCYSFSHSHSHTGRNVTNRRQTTGELSDGSNDWIAILIPYRDRAMHLRSFVPTIHDFLRKQFEVLKNISKEGSIRYCVFVVEQTFDARFNRGILFNIGYLQAKQMYPSLNFTCWIFHDVDLIPEDVRLIYECFIPQRSHQRAKAIDRMLKSPTAGLTRRRTAVHRTRVVPTMSVISTEGEIDNVKHLVVGIDQFNYTLLYAINVGGVLAVRDDQFLAVNGYSNLYFGYGGEDDDFYQRLKAIGIGIFRQPVTISRYRALRAAHVQAEPNVIVMALLSKAAERMPTDGLNVYVDKHCSSANISDTNSQIHDGTDAARCRQIPVNRFAEVSQPADVDRLVAATERRRGYSWILVRVCTTSPTFECPSKTNQRLNMLHQHGHDFHEHYY